MLRSMFASTVKLQNGKPIYVRDVADVRMSFEDRITYARLNGREVVTLAVRKRAGENLIRIAEEVKRITREEAKAMPAGVTLSVSNDQSITIENRVRELENSIMTGMFLVVMVLFMFFGLKNASSSPRPSRSRCSSGSPRWRGWASP